MATHEQKSRIYEFDHFRVDANEGLLWRDEHVVPLAPKAFEMLVLLVENNGHLVKKEELMQRVWPDTFVEEANLTNNISLLRKVLQGEGGENYIKTVPRRGYRFVADVRIPIDESAAVAPEERSFDQKEAREGRTTEKRFSFLTKVNWQLVTLGLALVGTLTLLGFGLSKWRERAINKASLAQIRSLAVLPLDNISGDSGQDYFSDGMTDALISELAQISSLRVISRNSMMNYKGARKPTPDIGRELSVDALIDGTVVRSGARIRITISLIQAATDQHLWTKSYERDLRDVLALQSEIGRDVAQEIRVKLTPQQQTRLAGARPVNAEAHEAYLKGLYYFNQGINERSEAILKKSSEYFQQAINLDPSYAPAHAGLSRSYHWVASWGIRSQELYPKAKSAALKALELDDTLAEAHVSLGYILFNYDWDWAGCEREYKRAFELSPGLTYGAYGLYLSAAGRHDEAVAKVKHEEELDPLTIPVKRNVGLVLIYARRYDEAIQQYQKVLELKPDAASSLAGLARAYTLKGRHAEAVAAIQKAAQIAGKDPSMKAYLAWVHAWSGKRAEAMKILAELEATSNREPPRINMAAAYTALGEKDKAFSWLERAYENHDQILIYLNVMPEFDNLRSDQRFNDLLRRIGISR
ncbi:MAG TPA: winged helix-turn-helix domain-containing protein [Pyrinomonadaceae bacterium]|jgi:TolB-like protein/DNA-binding winged helix-turn-helix (wHTH) protein/Flp pilus assembly protein TadD